MAKAIVHCRACGEAFDRNALVEGVDWIKPSNRVYFHKSCYETYQKNIKNINSKMKDEIWFDAMWDFLRKDLKGDFNFNKVKNQWNSFLKKKMSAKGIFFALRYFYLVKKGDLSKSEKGIGIVPSIYSEGCQYWLDREMTDEGICNSIEEQIKQAYNAKIRSVNRKKTTKGKIDASKQLAAIMNMEDDE